MAGCQKTAVMQKFNVSHSSLIMTLESCHQLQGTETLIFSTPCNVQDVIYYKDISSQKGRKCLHLKVIDSNPVLFSFLVTECHSGNWALKSHRLRCESCLLLFNGCIWESCLTCLDFSVPSVKKKDTLTS